VIAPSLIDFDSSNSAERSKSLTLPIPSQRVHIPPTRRKLRFSTFFSPPFWNVTAPAPLTVAVLNENALGGPTWGWPRRLKSTRNMALVSVTVPTVDRALAPMRSWSTRIAVVSPSSTSTSGRAMVGMNPCTKLL